MSEPNNQDTPVAWMVDRYWHDGSWLDREVCLSKPGHLDRDSRLKKRVEPLCYSDQLDRMRERAERAEALLAEAVKALEPLGTYDTADGLPDGTFRIPDSHPILFDDVEGTKPAVTIGHLRAVRTLLTKLQDTSHE